MSTTIESLELEVQSKAGSAVDGLEKLRETLTTLKTATSGGAGLGSVKRQLTSLNTALDTMSDSNIAKLNKIALGLKAFDGLGNIKLSSSVASQIGKISDATKNLNGTDFTVLGDLATSLTPLSSIGKSNLNSFISQLTRMPKALEGMKDSDIEIVTQKVKELSKALTPLANQMATISSGFAALPNNIKNTISGLNTMTAQSTRSAGGYGKLALKATAAFVAIKTGSRVVASWINTSNDYIENMNLFAVSMGQYGAEAKEYAQNVENIMGIDSGEWMRNQGVFMSLATGLGVASDRAYTMSKNMTQLGYDLASFWNISFEEAMQKVRSGFSGELEPLRNLGYDLSVARLQEEAYALGIQKKVSAMTQAEKAELRYYTMMKQNIHVQGDMARTLDSPINQLRILQSAATQAARSLGNMFIPALKAVLPVAIALMQVIRDLANTIAALFGFSQSDAIDWSGLGGAAGGVADTAGAIDDSLGGAGKKAKELKDALLGIDELNIIRPEEDTSGSGGGSGIGGGGGGFDFELPEYTFMSDELNTKIEELKETIKSLIPYVAAVGTAFASWKIAQGLIDLIDKIKNLKGFAEGFGKGFGSLGIFTLLSDIKEFAKYFEDFMDNGASFQNIAGMISEFVGMIGDSLMLLGSYELGGALKFIQGLGEICIAIKDITENGVNWDNAATAIRGLSNVAIAVGIFTDNIKLSAGAVVIQGFATILGEIDNIVEAIRTGDWSGVDKIALVIGIVEMLGGLVVAFDLFSKIKGVKGVSKTKEALESVTDVTSTLDTTVSTKLSPNLTSLAKNLGFGLLIVVEVTAAALLITGAIILLGKALEQVGLAWSPVIENGGTVAAGMGIGIGVLAGIGAVTALLGSAGTTLVVNMTLGIAILAEIGVAAALFIAEIWLVGKGLDEIGKAWKPVLKNGDTVASGITLGTALLVGVGVATAALGAATVASAGTLPLAIGLGTALLVELAAAFILFTESLVEVADELTYNLSPSLKNLNEKLPGISTNMGNFVDFMTEFADHVVAYSKVSAISSLSATVSTVISWFTEDPIGKLAKDVDNISQQTHGLNEKLRAANTELQSAITLLKRYQTFLSEIEGLTNCNVELSSGMFVNMNEVGQKLIAGFVAGIRAKSSEFSSVAREIVNSFKDNLLIASESSRSSMTTWASNLKKWFTDNGYGAINRTTFQTYAKDIISGFSTSIANSSGDSRSSMTTWASNLKKWFTDNGASYSTYYYIAEDVVDGFNDGINYFYDTTLPYMRRWASDAKAAYKKELDSNSPSMEFWRIARDTVLGYNIGIIDNGDSTKKVVTNWANTFTDIQPTMSFAVDTSALKYYDSDSFAKTVSANVSSNSNITAVGFKEAMEEFYEEYVEPTVTQMAEDMRRQADKKEQTVVQIGNRTITDAVTTQQNANGYRFVTA